MANMSYCMFQNTLLDLQQIAREGLNPDKELSLDEAKAKVRLFKVMACILRDEGYEVEAPKD